MTAVGLCLRKPTGIDGRISARDPRGRRRRPRSRRSSDSHLARTKGAFAHCCFADAFSSIGSAPPLGATPSVDAGTGRSGCPRARLLNRRTDAAVSRARWTPMLLALCHTLRWAWDQSSAGRSREGRNSTPPPAIPAQRTLASVADADTRPHRRARNIRGLRVARSRHNRPSLPVPQIWPITGSHTPRSGNA